MGVLCFFCLFVCFYQILTVYSLGANKIKKSKNISGWYIVIVQELDLKSEISGEMKGRTNRQKDNKDWNVEGSSRCINAQNKFQAMVQACMCAPGDTISAG